MAATPAVAQHSRWHQAAGCISASDRAICWLGQLVDSPQVNMDRELSRAPAVLQALGATLIDPDTQPPLPEPGLPAEFHPYADAVSQAALAIRTDAPAADVIAILRTLPVSDPPFLANPLQDQTLSFGRLDAYAMLSGDEIAGARPVLQDALLAAWEEDIPSDLEAVINGGPKDLADTLVQRGDMTSAERVLKRLSPGDAPAAVREMLRAGLLDAAHNLIRNATVSDRIAGLVKANAAMEKRAAAYLERMKPEMEAAMAEAMAGLSENDRALMLAQEFEEPEQESAEDLAALAASEVAEARIEVMNAAAATGRDDIALPLALELFRDGLIGDDENIRRGLISSLPILIKPAAPEAFAHMDAAEARLESLANSGPGMPLGAVYAGWMRLGRPDRAEAVLQRWRPLAERQARRFREGEGTDRGESQRNLVQDLVSILIDRDDVAGAEALGLMPPTAPLERDIERGLGLSRLEERLNGRSVNDQVQVLMACSARSQERGADQDAQTCADRLAEIADTPPRRLAAAELLLPLAQRALTAGDPAKAESLLIRALELGAPAAETDDIRAAFSFQLDHTIIAVSKGMLRRDGRLAPAPTAGDAARPPSP